MTIAYAVGSINGILRPLTVDDTLQDGEGQAPASPLLQAETTLNRSIFSATGIYSNILGAVLSGANLKGDYLLNIKCDALCGVYGEHGKLRVIDDVALAISSQIWQSGNIIRITADGTPDLTFIKVGQNIVITGSTNSSNNGSHRILAVNTGSYYMDVENSSRSGSTDDESSSPATAGVVVWQGCTQTSGGVETVKGEALLSYTVSATHTYKLQATLSGARGRIDINRCHFTLSSHKAA